MEFTGIFLVFAASMWAIWRRHEGLGLALVFVGMMVTTALYLHHATESLPLSF